MVSVPEGDVQYWLAASGTALARQFSTSWLSLTVPVAQFEPYYSTRVDKHSLIFKTNLFYFTLISKFNTLRAKGRSSDQLIVQVWRRIYPFHASLRQPRAHRQFPFHRQKLRQFQRRWSHY